jgi:O-antigen/teichoic acid export membrane protein
MAMALTMPAGALAHAAFPYLSERQQRLGEARALIGRLMWRTIALTAAVCTLGLLAGGPVISLLFGIEYSASVILFRTLLIAAFLRSLVGLIGTSIHALGRPDVNLGLLLITGTLNIALNIALVTRMGAVGAAWATNLVSLLNLILGWWALRRLILRSST